MDEVLIIDNATGDKCFVPFQEAAEIAAIGLVDLLQALDTIGVCNSIDFTVVDVARATEVVAA